MRYGDTVLLKWPLAEHIITAGWTYNNGGKHDAIDLRAKTGTPVFACEGGTVDWVQHWDGKTKTGNQSYGNLVRILHAPYKGKRLQTYYGHLASIIVKQGQSVIEGQIIGFAGNTGNSFGDHLHLEVRVNGTRYHPLNWLDGDFTCKDAETKAHLGKYTSVQIPEMRYTVTISSKTPEQLRQFFDLCDLLVLPCTITIPGVSSGDAKALESRANALGLEVSVK